MVESFGSYLKRTEAAAKSAEMQALLALQREQEEKNRLFQEEQERLIHLMEAQTQPIRDTARGLLQKISLQDIINVEKEAKKKGIGNFAPRTEYSISEHSPLYNKNLTQPMKGSRKNKVRVSDSITFDPDGIPNSFRVVLGWGEFRDKAPGSMIVNLSTNYKGDKFRYFQLSGGSTLGLVALRGQSTSLSVEEVIGEPSLLYPLVKKGIENSMFYEEFWCTCKSSAPHTHEIRSLPPSYPEPSSWRETNTLLTNSQKLSQALDKILDN